MTFDALEMQRTFARYNSWMNGKLLTECSKLPDEARKQPLSIPFQSLHGVWNHLLVADNLWLSRFQKTLLPFEFRGLDIELFADWEQLCAARSALDRRTEQFAGSLTSEQLEGELSWTPATNPTPRQTPFALALAHFWNHQTHHRGQITGVMELLGLDCGVTDLLALPDAPVFEC